MSFEIFFLGILILNSYINPGILTLCYLSLTKVCSLEVPEKIIPISMEFLHVALILFLIDLTAVVKLGNLEHFHV